MKALKIIAWIFVPYIMIFVDWRKLNKNSRIMALIWITVFSVAISTNSNSEEKPASSQETDPSPIAQTAVTNPPEATVAALGEPLSSFDKILGKANVNETFHRYKDDYVLVMPINDLAWNITVSFEQTNNKHRARDEALKIAKEFIPSDAVEVKQWEVEKGKDVIQYESKALASKFDANVFGENPAGTLIVIIKSDDNGVFSLIIAPGNNP